MSFTFKVSFLSSRSKGVVLRYNYILILYVQRKLSLTITPYFYCMFLSNLLHALLMIGFLFNTHICNCSIM